MKNLNLENEWIFIKDEVHKEEPNQNNLLKRELLFSLQLLLSNLSNQEDELIYKRTKEFYLNF